jgi:hypothetical protein
MGGHKAGPEAISEYASRGYETVYFYQLIFKQFILWQLNVLYYLDTIFGKESLFKIPNRAYPLYGLFLIYKIKKKPKTPNFASINKYKVIQKVRPINV